MSLSLLKQKALFLSRQLPFQLIEWGKDVLNLLFDGDKLTLNHLPDLNGVDTIILMNQHISESGQAAPGWADRYASGSRLAASPMTSKLRITAS